MREEQHLLQFKLKIQSLGALRPEAWAMILDLTQTTKLKANESFIRKEGTLAYIADGLLKEYDSHERKTPSIVNFLPTGQSLITRKYNSHHYLKACMATTVYHWSFDDLRKLYQSYSELKIIYDILCSSYDEGVSFQVRILEERLVRNRISLFLSRYKAVLPFLKKKDIANYLKVTYSKFMAGYNSLI